MSHLVKASSLKISDVSWGPSGHHPIIRNISFNVKAGERLAIIGPNGAGKSSLLRCLYRHYKPTTGRVLINDHDIWALAPRIVAQRVAAVLQEAPSDFPFTVADIVRTGRIPHHRFAQNEADVETEKINHALEHVGLASKRNRVFASLSGGEKQRVAIARALAQDPQILILDEPTNHLDIRQQLDILQLVRGLGITVIATLHDINHAAQFADRLALINNGMLVAHGRPEEVLTHHAIAAAFQVHSHQFKVPLKPGQHFFFSLPTQITTGD